MSVDYSIGTVKFSKGMVLLAALLSGAGLLIYAVPLAGLFRAAYRDDTFSYIVLIPLVSLYLVYEDRKRIFGVPAGSPIPGVVLSSLAILLYLVARKGPVGPSVPVERFALYALSAVLFFEGILGLLAGAGGLWAARFPLLFLIFMIPFPEWILGPIVRFLQAGSAEVSYWVIRSVGVPVFRDGFLFALPGLTIEVAEQCSGIRSGISLFLVGILAGHLFLKSGWRKLALAVTVVPITIAKNGLRIVMISLLGAYVDRQVLSGPLHKAGGIPFFGVALVMLAIVLWALRRGESRKTPRPPRDPDTLPGG
ncbi:exosortase/archaeosortase family protein [Candidatus Deferrimicrobium sp.]|jgi:exosortase|uniref:exosortase/archaeosortase family protein n=1 Tax=Candidatus Deferrimicrobium sp. TaxID=3060586 RepID=UPI002EDACA59